MSPLPISATCFAASDSLRESRTIITYSRCLVSRRSSIFNQRAERQRLIKFDRSEESFSGMTRVLESDMKTRYEMVIYWSQEDQAFIVEGPELPGCMADGRTYQEAVANAEVIISEWIETANEVGRDVPQPKGKLMYA